MAHPLTTPRRRGRSGAALVEGALVFLVVVLMFLGIMEFGRLVWTSVTLGELSREGARYAESHGATTASPATVDTIRAAVLRWATGLEPDRLTVTTTWIPNNQPGSEVRVTVSYNFPPMTPFIKAPSLSSTSRGYITY